jgi:vanillate O-demethylase monooxygenase subunit
MGRLVGDTVACGYHGLRFDAHGACVENPHGEGRIPASAKVPSYPLIERDGLIWIWMGEHEAGDPSALPDFAHLTSPRLKTIGDRMIQQCNYALLVDNLMDLSHVHYLHAPYQSVADFLQAPHEVTCDGTRLNSLRSLSETSAPMSFRPFLEQPDAPVDYWLNIGWRAPGVCQLVVGVVPVGRPREAALRRIGTHVATPETATTTHYFYASSRNYRLHDAEADEETRQWQQVGFHEQDKPMLEAVQRMMGTTDLDALKPVLLPSDAAAVRVRRLMQSLIDTEAAAVTAA